jgi:microcompartment protein CcmL/EutN
MKKFPAMASVEFNGIAVGMHATDAMLKKSPISLIKCGTISRGRYLAVLGGTTASVLEALQEGLYWAKEQVIDYTFLPDIHPLLHDAVLGERAGTVDGAFAIVETPTVSSNIHATEMALKGTPVQLVEIRLGDTQMGGRGMTIYQGELHDIEAAVDIATGYLEAREITCIHRILTAPHEAMIEQVNNGTRFNRSLNLEMEGEEA